MKKILLPIVSLLFAVGNASAQISNPVKAALAANRAAHCTAVAPTHWTSAGSIAVRKPMRADESIANVDYLFVDGADIPCAADGFPEAKQMNAVFAKITSDMLTKYSGWTIVGIAFNVAASLGNNPSLLVMALGDDNYYHFVAGGNIEDYVVSSQEEGIVLNEVGVQQKYTIPEKPVDLFFGYSYTQVTDKTDPNAKPIFIGKTTDCSHGYFVWADFGSGAKIYIISDKDEFPYALCAQLVLQKGDETAVVGVNGTELNKVIGRYSVDGKRLASGAKGLCIEKMSDGSTRKVFRQ